MSLESYRRIQTIAASPRHTEHRLMSEITAQMIAARDAGFTGAALIRPLHRNREVWSAFSTLCGTAGNQLPDKLRAQIVSIALWVDRYTTDVMAGHGDIDDLIEVNKSIISGLASGQQAAAA